MKTVRIGLVAVGLGVVLAGGGPLTAGQAAPQAAPASELDVEMAVDGTGSMASAIAQAKASGVAFTDGLISLRPTPGSPWWSSATTAIRRGNTKSCSRLRATAPR